MNEKYKSFKSIIGNQLQSFSVSKEKLEFCFFGTKLITSESVKFRCQTSNFTSEDPLLIHAIRKLIGKNVIDIEITKSQFVLITEGGNIEFSCIEHSQIQFDGFDNVLIIGKVNE